MTDSIDDLPDERVKQMWLALAQRYHDEPLILYDLIPEPHDTTKEKLKAAYLDLIPLPTAIGAARKEFLPLICAAVVPQKWKQQYY